MIHVHGYVKVDKLICPKTALIFHQHNVLEISFLALWDANNNHHVTNSKIKQPYFP